MFSSSAPLSQDSAVWGIFLFVFIFLAWRESCLDGINDCFWLINHCKFAIVSLIHPVGLCPNLLNIDFVLCTRSEKTLLHKCVNQLRLNKQKTEEPCGCLRGSNTVLFTWGVAFAPLKPSTSAHACWLNKKYIPVLRSIISLKVMSQGYHRQTACI